MAVSQVSRGERVKVPKPAPHRQMATARERCLEQVVVRGASYLVKWLAVATMAGRYIRPNPTPVKTLQTGWGVGEMQPRG